MSGWRWCTADRKETSYLHSGRRSVFSSATRGAEAARDEKTNKSTKTQQWSKGAPLAKWT
eukprot:1237056-Amphidinium_carterae.1